jgi:hypothetical protein
MTNRAPGRVNVTIDRLIMRGVDVQQRDTVVHALVEELRRQWSNGETARQFGASRSIASARPGPFHLAADAKPRQLGTQAAHAIARSART